MNDRRLLDEGAIDSAVLREATLKLNFIWRLAFTYKAPELLEWLDDLTEELIGRRDFVKTTLKSRKASAVA
jgi:hypothetical protein